ncbi:hypothetical protein AOLI_G00113620 [Acnodon oligacanthus]
MLHRVHQRHLTCMRVEEGVGATLRAHVQPNHPDRALRRKTSRPVYGRRMLRSHENRRVELNEELKLVGLSDLDLESCDVSETWKENLAGLALKYEDVFSRHHLDCGEAKGFVHRIHLVDDKPFRLPFHRVPPAEYQKLKCVLDVMVEREIIRKPTSEYASPLVLVWKKNADLRVCTDFRWLNKRTLKDAHPLPHQADCLVALGGNALFSTMDLTSGFYNMPLH